MEGGRGGSETRSPAPRSGPAVGIVDGAVDHPSPPTGEGRQRLGPMAHDPRGGMLGATGCLVPALHLPGGPAPKLHGRRQLQERRIGLTESQVFRP